MKIPEYLGKTDKRIEKEFAKIKPSFCEGCGSPNSQKIKKMNTLYDTGTGEKVITYCIERKCSRNWLQRNIQSFGAYHTGDDYFTDD